MNRGWTIGFGLAAFSLWLAWVFQVPIVRATSLYWRPETLGQWGDTFGALNALFAAAAFIGVISSLALQRQQFARQQEAIERQQREIADAQAEQHRQRFESSYFQLIDLLRKLRGEITFAYSNKYRELNEIGKQHFEAQGAVQAAVHEMRYWMITDGATLAGNTQESVAERYETHVHAHNEDGLGPYFRIIYTILRRVLDDRILTTAEKIAYSNLLRSQLSSDDIALAAINALSNVSGDFDKYLIEFRMLKYLPDTPMRKSLEKLYPALAFEARD